MHSPEQDDLVISTPERVAFQYEVAGIGSRFLAQVIDMLVIWAVQLVIIVLALAVGTLLNAGTIGLLLGLLLTFALLAGYFLVSEAAWNGQTLGKRAFRLRVVGDQGQPLTVGQSVIRNLVRLVDFLPLFYGIGILVMFLNRRSKRLGDLAAGTLVVRDKHRINLYDLSSQAGSTQAQPPTPPAASIWSSAPEAPASDLVSSVPTSAAPPLNPALRRLVVAYAARRETLPLHRRQALASDAGPALRAVLPDVVANNGPLAALDMLAEREGISPVRPMHPAAGSAMAWGISSLVFILFFPVGIVTGILSIVFANRALRAIRREPERYQGADRARTARVLGIVGLAICTLIALLFVIGLIFRNG